jgi:hypothetical protein
MSKKFYRKPPMKTLVVVFSVLIAAAAQDRVSALDKA